MEKHRKIYTEVNNIINCLSGLYASLTIILSLLLLLILFSGNTKTLLKLFLPFASLLLILTPPISIMKRKFITTIPLFIIIVSITLLIFLLPIAKSSLLGKIIKSETLLYPLSVLLIIITSVSITHPIKRSWDALQEYYLNFMTPLDYELSQRKRTFFRELEKAFYNARKYSFDFGILIFHIASRQKLEKLIPKRKIHNFREEVRSTVKNHIRKTDIVDFLTQEFIYCILLGITHKECESVAERIKLALENFNFSALKNFKLKTNYIIQSYQPSFKNEKELFKLLTSKMQLLKERMIEKPTVIKL